MDKLAYSLTEPSEVLSVSRPTVYALIKQPVFPVCQIGSLKLVSVEGLRDWIRSQTEVTA